MGRVRTAFVLASLFFLVGCPREVSVPNRPSGATPCASELDCNEASDAGVPCGLVYACIDGFCEATPSRTRPCGRE